MYISKPNGEHADLGQRKTNNQDHHKYCRNNNRSITQWDSIDAVSADIIRQNSHTAVLQSQSVDSDVQAACDSEQNQTTEALMAPTSSDIECSLLHDHPYAATLFQQGVFTPPPSEPLSPVSIRSFDFDIEDLSSADKRSSTGYVPCDIGIKLDVELEQDDQSSVHDKIIALQSNWDGGNLSRVGASLTFVEGNTGVVSPISSYTHTVISCSDQNSDLPLNCRTVLCSTKSHHGDVKFDIGRLVNEIVNATATPIHHRNLALENSSLKLARMVKITSSNKESTAVSQALADSALNMSSDDSEKQRLDVVHTVRNGFRRVATPDTMVQDREDVHKAQQSQSHVSPSIITQPERSSHQITEKSPQIHGQLHPQPPDGLADAHQTDLPDSERNLASSPTGALEYDTRHGIPNEDAGNIAHQHSPTQADRRGSAMATLTLATVAEAAARARARRKQEKDTASTQANTQTLLPPRPSTTTNVGCQTIESPEYIPWTYAKPQQGRRKDMMELPGKAMVEAEYAFLTGVRDNLYRNASKRRDLQSESRVSGTTKRVRTDQRNVSVRHNNPNHGPAGSDDRMHVVTDTHSREHDFDNSERATSPARAHVAVSGGHATGSGSEERNASSIPISITEESNGIAISMSDKGKGASGKVVEAGKKLSRPESAKLVEKNRRRRQYLEFVQLERACMAECRVCVYRAVPDKMASPLKRGAELSKASSSGAERTISVAVGASEALSTQVNDTPDDPHPAEMDEVAEGTMGDTLNANATRRLELAGGNCGTKGCSRNRASSAYPSKSLAELRTNQTQATLDLAVDRIVQLRALSVELSRERADAESDLQRKKARLACSEGKDAMYNRSA